ncbi:putative aldo/keto reductase [Mycena vulgaris]|nr:putative aldo/keto reductase [Mycena vulgaris]
MTGARGDPEYVKEQCNQLLKRLGVDYIHLYFQNRVDANTPVEKTVGAMAELVREGKIRYLGLSDRTAAGLHRAYANPPLLLIQAARFLGTKIICYSPLGRGFLTGQIKSVDNLDADDLRRTVLEFAAANFPKISGLAAKIGEVSEAPTTLAWILAQGEDCLPHSRNEEGQGMN